MTGFGVGSASGPWGSLQVSVRTLNHRHLEVAIHLPRGWAALEEPLARRVRERLVRGRVDVQLAAQESPGAQRKVRLQAPVLLEYWRQLQEIQQQLGLTSSLSIGQLLALPEVVRVDEPEPEDPQVTQAACRALDEALDQVESMRRREGERLWAGVEERLQAVERTLQFLRARRDEVVRHWAARLEARAQALLGQLAGAAVAEAVRDEGWQRRLAQEVALWAERSDITEELDRLASHVGQMRVLATQPAPGRRMEFLLREMDREASTAASKAPSSEMVHALVELRWELERVREQVLNFE